jgi:hypothetical protein
VLALSGLEDILLVDFFNAEIGSARQYTVGSFALHFDVVERLIQSLQEMLNVSDKTRHK